MLLQKGADPEKSTKEFPTPLLPYVIICGQIDAIDTSDVVRVLLASGADPKTVPVDMWVNYINAPKERWPNPGPGDHWRGCTVPIRQLLARSLNVRHRYLLSLADTVEKTNPRTLQVCEAYNMKRITTLPYFLVGQRQAADLVMNSLITHVSGGRESPMVMAFAGPSGHGKTELARALGKLLSIESLVFDCATFTQQSKFFGPPRGYQGYEEGAPGINFLSENNGRRSLVFMDEFDKTKQELRESLLVTMEKGTLTIHQRTSNNVDCSKTIWVLATNLGTYIICDFYAKKLASVSEERLRSASVKELQRDLTRIYRENFKAPLTGRIKLMVPFLPFSKTEQAVIAHRFILKLATRVRQPIDLQPPTIRLVGHSRITVIDDRKVCTELAQGYESLLGARYLFNAVDALEEMYTKEYLAIKSPITEDLNTKPLQEFIVKCVPEPGGNGQRMLVYR
ncbi:P-loop containing nucleoside triphosphate hydrolase protein, partial [Sporormia fimetaria CBS 119925]